MTDRLSDTPIRRVMIVTDAWHPQVNGVVRTITATVAELLRRGVTVAMVTPDQFRTLALPFYREIRLALVTPGMIGRRIVEFRPDAVHITTEGPLGLAARIWCAGRGIPFTTAFHTRFPEYVASRLPIPTATVWRYLRWFHRPAMRVLAATRSLRQELRDQRLTQAAPWSRGVDVRQFNPDGPRHPLMTDLPRPVLLSVGRVAVEKNVDAFCACAAPGTKVVIGDGPDLARLRRAFPEVLFLGRVEGAALASAYRAADVFAFPSRTDTFGLVIIEALRCGTPVAAYPVPGPRDILNNDAGAMDDDLARAIARALNCDRAAAARLGERYGWEQATDEFVAALACIETDRSAPMSPPSARRRVRAA